VSVLFCGAGATYQNLGTSVPAPASRPRLLLELDTNYFELARKRVAAHGADLYLTSTVSTRVNADAVSPPPRAREVRRTGTHEWIEDRVANERKHTDKALRKLDRERRGVTYATTFVPSGKGDRIETIQPSNVGELP